MKHLYRELLIKYRILLLLAVLTGGIFVVLILSGFWGDDGGIRLVDREKMEQIRSSGTENAELNSLDDVQLLLDGVPVPMDRSTDTYYITQNMFVDGWEGELTSASTLVHIYMNKEQWRISKAERIRSGEPMDVLLTRGAEYQNCRLIVSGLPMISIETEDEYTPEYSTEDIDNYVFNSDTRFLGTITIQGADQHSGTYRDNTTEPLRIVQKHVSYHARGASSNDLDKKGFALKLTDEEGKKQSEELFGLGKSCKWKLLAASGDKTRIREKTAWQIWEEMADRAGTVEEHATGMEYCELILDGEYRGLFEIIKGINEETLRLSKDQILYKAIQEEMPLESDIDASIAAGYEVAYPIRIRYPKKEDIDSGMGMAAAWEPMKRLLGCTEWRTSFRRFNNLVNNENIADLYIFLQVTSAMDNSSKNTYRIATPGEEDSYTIVYLPWDLNYTFGDIFTYEIEKQKTQYEPDTSIIYCHPVLRQYFDMEDYGAGAVLGARWSDLRDDCLSDEHILGLMRDNMDYLTESGAFAREAEKWPETGINSDLTEILRYEKERLEFLDAYFGKYVK